jgi:O-antigen/teichoic acid export membrane protein
MSKAFGRAAAAKAVLLVTGSTYVSLLFGLLTSAIIARAVGPEDFGRYSYVMWISGILVVVANNGLTTTALRFISENLGKGDTQAANNAYGWLLRRQRLTLLLTVVVFAATVQLTLPLDWNLPITYFVLVVVVSLVAKAFAILEISAAKGHGQFVVDAVASTIMAAVSLVVAAGLYLVQAPALAYMVLFAVANIIYYAISRRMTKGYGIVPSFGPLDDELRTRIRSHLFWTIVLTLAAAFGNKASETYLLSKFVGVAEVGFFAIAVAFTRGGVDMLAVGLNTVLMPLMAHGYGQGGTARVHAILSNSVRLFTFGGFLLAGVGVMWADVIVTLMYGDEFHQASNVLRVMIVVAGITLSQSAFGALLSTTDNQRVRAGVAVASVVVSVVAALILVPLYGLRGAVLSFAVSSLLMYVVVWVGISRMLQVRLPWRELARLLLSAATAALLSGALLLLGQSLIVQFCAGLLFALFYLPATVLFRAWHPDDYGQLRPLAKRYPKVLGRAVPALERWANR